MKEVGSSNEGGVCVVADQDYWVEGGRINSIAW